MAETPYVMRHLAVGLNIRGCRHSVYIILHITAYRDVDPTFTDETKYNIWDEEAGLVLYYSGLACIDYADIGCWV